jgi:Uncharacterized protein conserved in bacteria (DUF2087)
MTLDPAAQAGDGPLLERLSLLVVKRGVSLGNLAEADRDLVLALAATAVPVGEPCTEPQVNEALRRSLQAEAACLDTDHVELRRWLVDGGWWRRDGYGRRYERVPADELAPPLQSLAQALARLDLPVWVAGQRSRLDAQREARRAAWAASQGAPNG